MTAANGYSRIKKNNIFFWFINTIEKYKTKHQYILMIQLKTDKKINYYTIRVLPVNRN